MDQRGGRKKKRKAGAIEQGASGEESGSVPSSPNPHSAVASPSGRAAATPPPRKSYKVSKKEDIGDESPASLNNVDSMVIRDVRLKAGDDSRAQIEQAFLTREADLKLLVHLEGMGSLLDYNPNDIAVSSVAAAFRDRPVQELVPQKLQKVDPSKVDVSPPVLSSPVVAPSAKAMSSINSQKALAKAIKEEPEATMGPPPPPMYTITPEPVKRKVGRPRLGTPLSPPTPSRGGRKPKGAGESDSDDENDNDFSASRAVNLRGSGFSVLKKKVQLWPWTETEFFANRLDFMVAPNPLDSTAVKQKAKFDAEVHYRMSVLQQKGMLSARRVPKAAEPPRTTTHWDYVLKEIGNAVADYREERKWKIMMAKKIANDVKKFHRNRDRDKIREKRDQELALRERARWIARQVKTFWGQVEELIVFKHQSVLDEKKKSAMDRHLDFLVGQTEKYSEMLAKDLQVSSSTVGQTRADSMDVDDGASVAGSSASLAESATAPEPEGEDAEFDPTALHPEEAASDDDEGTMAEAEKLLSNDKDMLKGEDEVAALLKEGEAPLEELLKNYPPAGDLEVDEESAGAPAAVRTRSPRTPKTPAGDDEEEEPMDEDDDGNDADEYGTEWLVKSEGQPAPANDQERLEAVAKAAQAFQPTGFTLATSTVKTPVPFLLNGSLREYQHIGLDWLVTMYEKKLNGILADEMGLGKTIMTISLLAHLAGLGHWGPHLIIVPSSVLLNWEMELKRWCPAFKILTYFGTPKERKRKRVGWTKPNSFHVCLTSYKLATTDAQMFKRKKWFYIILDEAHNIKNFKSQRWQTLLTFKSKRRLLLTGTPLQNNLMELWALMHFLMPHVFQSHKEFKDWFSNPVSAMVEGSSDFNNALIARLHSILRPFILRRLKKDVAKQLPGKHEHVMPCKLSKRQRFLYDEFMSNATTQATLKNGSYLGIANVLMQLRKVCNHPDLFEARRIVSPFDQERLYYNVPSLATKPLDYDPYKNVSLQFLNLSMASTEVDMSHLQAVPVSNPQPKKARNPTRMGDLTNPIIYLPRKMLNDPVLDEIRIPLHSQQQQSHYATRGGAGRPPAASLAHPNGPILPGLSFLEAERQRREAIRMQQVEQRITQLIYMNELRAQRKPLYGNDAVRLFSFEKPTRDVHIFSQNPRHYFDVAQPLVDAVHTGEWRAESELETVKAFTCFIPKARAPPIQVHCPHPDPSAKESQSQFVTRTHQHLMPKLETLHPARIRTQIYFPDKRLLQYDCGKLQALVGLLRDLKKDGHRALIFTQMTKMLDILEAFLNIHGYTYLRLDGAVRVDQRLSLMERFNNDPRIFLFILTTRTGGLGINLTGADTVIFYDSDWNPAMDAQAQDRSHRIGQTREVHIWRLVSEFTIEENILKKARQKLALDQIIKDGNFTTESFQKTDIRELMSDAKNEMIGEESGADRSALGSSAFDGTQSNISDKEMEQALLAAEDETDVAALRMVRREEAEENEEDFGDDPNQPQSLVDPDDPLMSRLTAIQRYAVKFLEEVNPVIDKEALALQSEFIEAEEKEWERDTLRRLQEGQRSDDEELDDDDDDDITPIRTRSPALPSFVISNSSTAPKRGRPVTTGASSVDGAKRKRGRPPRKRKNANRGEDEFRLDGGGDDEGQGDMAMTYEVNNNFEELTRSYKHASTGLDGGLDAEMDDESDVPELPPLFGLLYPDNDELYVPPMADLDSFIEILKELEIIERGILNRENAMIQHVQRQVNGPLAGEEKDPEKEKAAAKSKFQEQIKLQSDVYEFDRASRNLDLENYTVSENFTTHTIAPFTPEEDKRIEDLVDKFGLNFKLVTAYLNTSTFVLEILPALNLASSNAYMTLNSSMIVRTESHVFWRWKDYILPRTAAETAKATKRPNSPHSLLQTIKRFIDEKKSIPGRANEISVPEISGRAAGQTHSSHAKLVMEARAAFSAGAFGALVKERVTSDIGAAVINPELVARWADHQKADEMRRITLLKKKMLDEQQQREAVVRQQQHQAQQQIAQAAVAAAAATTVLPVLTTPPVGPIRSVSPAPPLSVPKHPAPLGGPNPATRPLGLLSSDRLLATGAPIAVPPASPTKAPAQPFGSSQPLTPGSPFPVVNSPSSGVLASRPSPTTPTNMPSPNNPLTPTGAITKPIQIQGMKRAGSTPAFSAAKVGGSPPFTVAAASSIPLAGARPGTTTQQTLQSVCNKLALHCVAKFPDRREEIMTIARSAQGDQEKIEAFKKILSNQPTTPQ